MTSCERRKMVVLDCGQSSRKTSCHKVDWMASVTAPRSFSTYLVIIVILCFLLNHVDSIRLDNDCLRACMALKDYPAPSLCPKEDDESCDWKCEAYLKNCTGDTRFHCAKMEDSDNYTRECALPVTCKEGTEPVITKKDGHSVVKCVPCRDEMFYNPDQNRKSETFSRCTEHKYNQCTMEFHKKDCAQERGQNPWNQQSISDGFCRCDARAGYEPFDDPAMFKEEFCFTDAKNCKKDFCDPGMELSLNYVCIPKCADGFTRTELSDDCKNLTSLTTEAPQSSTTRPSIPPDTKSPPLDTTPAHGQNSTVFREKTSDNTVAIVTSVVFGVLLVVGTIVFLIQWKKRHYSAVPTNNSEDSNLNSANVGSMCPRIFSCNQFLCTNELQPNNKDNQARSSDDDIGIECAERETGTRGIRGIKDNEGNSEDKQNPKKVKSKMPNHAKNCDVDQQKSPCCITIIAGNQIISKGGEINIGDQDTDDHTRKSLFSIKLLEQVKDIFGLKADQSARTSRNEDIELIEADKDNPSQRDMDINDEETELDSSAIMVDQQLPIPSLKATEFKTLETEQLDKQNPVEALLNKLKAIMTGKWTKVTAIDVKAVQKQLETEATRLGMNLKDLMTLPKILAQPSKSLLRYPTSNIPDGFVAYNTTGMNNSCLYQAVSILLYGDESHQQQLRLCCAVHAVENMPFFKKKFEEHFQNVRYAGNVMHRVQQVFTCYGVKFDENLIDTCHNWKDLLDEMLFTILVETCDNNNDSSQLHVRILGNAIGWEIVEHFENTMDPNPCKDLQLVNIEKSAGLPQLNIYWCQFKQGSSKEINHIVPLIPVRNLEKEELPTVDNHFGDGNDNSEKKNKASQNPTQSQRSNARIVDESGSSKNGAKVLTGQDKGNLTDYPVANDDISSKTIAMGSRAGNAVSVGGISSSRSVQDCNNSSRADENKLAEDVQENGETRKKQKNVGDRVDIVEYAKREWSANKPKTTHMREGYEKVKRCYQLRYIQQIRGDNYCGIRSAVFQTLVNKIPPPRNFSTSKVAVEKLEKAFLKNGLGDFRFAEHRTRFSKQWIILMKNCLLSFYEMVLKMVSFRTNAEREKILLEALNSDTDCDLNIMEAVKLLMALSAVNLHGDKGQGKKLPDWAEQLFARDDSTTVALFINNHLNKMGHEGGLEQVEMCLLGYSLGVRIRVLRLSHLNEDSFEAFYPQEGTDSWPVVTLISEDDRHYNIPVE